jgi:glucose-6-phosphate-specific signal transduction histidine kinase
LTGMQERVFLAGGSLEFDSAPGKGTIVTLKLPLISVQTNAVHPEHPAEPS